METPFLIFLMVFVAWGWLAGYKKAAVFAAAVMVIARQDSALWLFVLGLAVFQQERRLPWREAVGVVGLTLPWFAFAWWKYGAILPNSAAAKIGQNNLMSVGSSDLPFWQQFLHLLTGQSVLILVILLLTAGLALLLEYFIKRELVGWWLISWLITYIFVYTLLDVVNFIWYFGPPITVAMLIFALGFDALRRWIQQFTSTNNFSQTWIGFELSSLLGLLVIVSFGIEIWQATQIQTQSVKRADYFQVGQWLATHTEPEDVVASIEIGIIGYESRRPLLDTMGLVSPDMTKHQVGWLETLVYALDAHSPDYLVVLPDTAWDTLLSQWWFQGAYEPAVTFQTATIYQQKPPAERFAQPINIAMQGGLQLTELFLSTDKLRPGLTIDMWLKVIVQQQQPNDYQLTMYLVDAQDNWFAVTKEFPFSGGYNSSKWQPGDELEIPVRMMIPSDLPDGAYQIGIILFDPAQNGGLPLAAMPEITSPDIRVGWLRLGEPTFEQFATAVSFPLDLDWEQSLTLEAINVGIVSGETAPLQLVWQVGQPLSRDLATFVHLLDAEGNIVTQVDQRPFQGRWPTTVWESGETIVQPMNLPLLAELPLDAVQLRVGLYDASGRLPLAGLEEDFWQFDVDLRDVGP